MANLEPVWLLSTGVTSGHESPPVVNDGIMFVTTPEGPRHRGGRPHR